MIIQEKIKKEAEGYGKLAPAFIEGAKFTLENQWISVKDDLPCNHKELMDGEHCTKSVLVVLTWNVDPSKKLIKVCSMCDILGSVDIGRHWQWHTDNFYTVIYWMPIPEVSKE